MNTQENLEIVPNTNNPRVGDEGIKTEEQVPLNPQGHDSKSKSEKFGDAELLRGDVTQGFLDQLENVLENTNAIYLLSCEERQQQRIPGSLSIKYDIESVTTVLDDKGSQAFTLAKLKKLKNDQIQFLIITEDGYGILTIRRSGFVGCLYEIGGAGLLEFKQRKNVFCNYIIFDEWKTLLKIRGVWVSMFPCCLLIPSKTACMEILNLDGTSTGSIEYNKTPPAPSNIPINTVTSTNASKLICINFIPNLNRKAKYMMFAACLIPYMSYFSTPGQRRSSLFAVLGHILVLAVLVGIGLGIYFGFCS